MARTASTSPASKAEKPYLTEASLGRFLRERLDPDIIADKTIPGLVQRFRPDYRSERHKLIVEFDGDQHYQRAIHVIGDADRDAIFIGVGYRIIRIPYFVQLTPPMIEIFFGDFLEKNSNFKNYPHGFIDDRVIFPADFCEIGIERFRSDLERFSPIRTDIEQSLRRACAAKGDWRLVYPPSLRPAEVARQG